jgi:elongation factor G
MPDKVEDTAKGAKGTRCVALVGPQGSGKTTLTEALLFAAGAIASRGSVAQRNTVSDANPEARARQMSTELTPVRCNFMGDEWVVLDCPGAIDLIQESHHGMMMADTVVVVTDPQPERMLALAPIFRFLDAHKIPHILFINKMDTASGSVRDLLAAAQRQSSRPLVLRHIPLVEGSHITGYVDLVAERAYHYELDKPSARIPLDTAAPEETDDARRTLLEKLSDFDDALLEKLLEDVVPDKSEVYRQLTKDLQEDLIVPVLIGAAEHEHGVRRLFKALRHEVPGPEVTVGRLGIPAGKLAAQVLRVAYAPHVGKLSLLRVWRGTLKDGETLAGQRVSNLQEGAEPKLGKARLAAAGPGAIAALSKLDAGAAGTVLTETAAASPAAWPAPPPPLYTLAIAAKDRKDDVKLGEALRKLAEEDPSLVLHQNTETAELLLRGQGEMHLLLAIERLKRKFDLQVQTHRPQVPYRETIRKGTTHHARFKRQSGGHGQFADIKVDIKPLPRGSGVTFTDSIVGGVVPRNFIPAVEAGVRDNTARGPLGFPVVDLDVRLFDGQFHSVDSSDQAFRTAGRMAMTEGLPACDPVLLEPINEVRIHVPADFTSKVQRAVTQRRAQILGFDAREGWDGWEEIRVNMPEAEMQDLILEIRSISQGIGTFDAAFSHFQELTGRDADKVVDQRKRSGADSHP